MPTFEKSLVYSLSFHLLLGTAILAFSKFDSSIWKKPPPVSTVVWTQTVKRPQPTIPDKLPPPLVPIKKVEEVVKEKEINIKKVPSPEPPKPPEETREEKMKKALAKLKTGQVEDDRPTPKEDNFPTQDPKKPDSVMSDTEMLALQASGVYSAYQQQIKEVVQSNLIWFKNEKIMSQISMRVDAQGNISSVKIDRSSGDASYDQATLRAVQKTGRVPAPPQELLKMFLQEPVVFNFEWKPQ